MQKSLPYIFAQSLEDDPMNVVTIPVCSKCGKDYPKKMAEQKVNVDLTKIKILRVSVETNFSHRYQ